MCEHNLDIFIDIQLQSVTQIHDINSQSTGTKPVTRGGVTSPSLVVTILQSPYAHLIIFGQ